MEWGKNITVQEEKFPAIFLQNASLLIKIAFLNNNLIYERIYFLCCFFHENLDENGKWENQILTKVTNIKKTVFLTRHFVFI